MDEAQLKQLRMTVPIGEYRFLDSETLEDYFFSSSNLSIADLIQSPTKEKNELNLYIDSLGGENFDGKLITNCAFATDLYDTSFIETIIEDSIFYDAGFTGSRFDKAEITDSRFTGANFTDSRFDKAEITDSRFTGANFTRANFTRAVIRDSNLNGADFTGADFTGAKFCESSLYKVRGLEDALNITDATFDCTTIDETNYEIIRKEFLYEGITLDNGRTKDGEILFEILSSNPDDLLAHIVPEIADLRKYLTWKDTTSEMNEKYDTDFSIHQIKRTYNNNKDF